MKTAAVIEKMIKCSEGNVRDISHFMKVWGFARILGEFAEHLDHAEMAGFDQIGDGDRECGFKADDAVGCGGEALPLFVRMVRGVVGRDRVDRAVFESFNDRRDIVCGAERRVHFGIRIARHAHLIGE